MNKPPNSNFRPPSHPPPPAPNPRPHSPTPPQPLPPRPPPGGSAALAAISEYTSPFEPSSVQVNAGKLAADPLLLAGRQGEVAEERPGESPVLPATRCRSQQVGWPSRVPNRPNSFPKLKMQSYQTWCLGVSSLESIVDGSGKAGGEVYLTSQV